MQYPRFVAMRRAIWDELEARLEAARHRPKSLSHDDLEQLAFQYRQVLHDHALVETRFPRTGVAARLRRLTLLGTRLLHHDRGDRHLSLRYFFAVAFPRAFQQHLTHLAAATVLFLATALFGLGMAGVQPQLGAVMLGPERIEDLIDGKLWTEALVTTIPPSYSTSMIATNNMTVAIVAWIGGALAGLGSLYILLLNGLNLGCIIGITMHYRMASPLLEFVAAHGPLEITLILVSAAAGLGLASALVVAEDRPRWLVLRERTLHSVVVLLGCLPWFLLLAAVEALVSPSHLFAPWLKALLGLGLLVLFLAVALNPNAKGSP